MENLDVVYSLKGLLKKAKSACPGRRDRTFFEPSQTGSSSAIAGRVWKV